MDTEQRIQAKQDKVDTVKTNAQRFIWVTFQREGVHNYPDAKINPALATGDEYDVSFLAHPHRHMFHFKIAIEVFHNDREIEFIQFKRWCLNGFNQDILQLDYKSCEMLSDELYNYIANRYPERDITISVSEDNENGSEIHYTKL